MNKICRDAFNRKLILDKFLNYYLCQFLNNKRGIIALPFSTMTLTENYLLTSVFRLNMENVI